MKKIRGVKLFQSLSIVCVMTAIAAGAMGAELNHALFRAIRDRDDDRVERFLRQNTPVNVRSSNGTSETNPCSVRERSECRGFAASHVLPESSEIENSTE